MVLTVISNAIYLENTMASTLLQTASNNTFSVTFNKIPTLSSLIQNVNFPSIDLSISTVPYQGMKIPADSGTISYGPLTFQIRIDEDHTIIKDIYTWAGLLHGNCAVDEFPEVKLVEKKEDLTLHVLNSNQQPLFDYEFIGCIISSFDVDPFVRGQSEKLLATLTLSFDYFKIN